jgi:zinc D-Ala-D-Ala carboxypeptidase
VELGTFARAVGLKLLRSSRKLTLTIRFRKTGYTKMGRWHYFTDLEVEGLDPEFVAKLDQARHHAKTPFTITSGKRTPDDNERAMGVEGSSHCKGLAVDLRCGDSRARKLIVAGLLHAGFSRIGIYDRHVHVDQDPDKDSDVIWLGKSY